MAVDTKFALILEGFGYHSFRLTEGVLSDEAGWAFLSDWRMGGSILSTSSFFFFPARRAAVVMGAGAIPVIVIDHYELVLNCAVWWRGGLFFAVGCAHFCALAPAVPRLARVVDLQHPRAGAPHAGGQRACTNRL